MSVGRYREGLASVERHPSTSLLFSILVSQLAVTHHNIVIETGIIVQRNACVKAQVNVEPR